MIGILTTRALIRKQTDVVHYKRPQLCLEWQQSDAARILMRLFEAYLFLDEIDKKETNTSLPFTPMTNFKLIMVGHASVVASAWSRCK